MRPAALDVVLGDSNETIRVRVGKWPQQQAIDHAEYGGRGADPESEDRDHRSGEEGTLWNVRTDCQSVVLSVKIFLFFGRDGTVKLASL